MWKKSPPSISLSRTFRTTHTKYNQRSFTLIFITVFYFVIFLLHLLSFFKKKIFQQQRLGHWVGKFITSNINGANIAYDRAATKLFLLSSPRLFLYAKKNFSYFLAARKVFSFLFFWLRKKALDWAQIHRWRFHSENFKIKFLSHQQQNNSNLMCIK